MKRIDRENNFLIVWLMCFMLLFGAGNLGFLKETWSAFGNITGQLTVPYTMSYYSNYPDELGFDEEQRTASVVGKSYTIMVNVFEASGYEFVNWNTSVDGSGDVYNPGESIPLEKNLTLYAQWKKALVVTVSYGDVNVDGVVNEDDYLLIEKYVNGGEILVDDALLNADVNVDGKVDLVDVDIVKQVCLGTVGYVGYLPNSPILVYDIYEGNIDIGTDSDDTSNEDGASGEVDDNSQGSSSSGVGGGSSSSGDSSSSGNNGSSGSGNGSGSGSSGGKKPSSQGSTSSGKGQNSGSTSGNGGSNQGDISSDEKNSDNGDDVSKNEDELSDVLTENTEDKDNNFSNNDEEMEENNDKEQQKKENYSLYGGIFVFGICLLSVRLIFHLVYKFNEKEKNGRDELDI